MKNLWQKVKPILIAAFWVLCCCGIVTLLGFSVIDQRQLKFSDIIVKVDESNGMMFIDKDDVLQILRDNQVTLQKAKAASSIKYNRLEQTLESNPWIEHADIFVDASEKIRINIKQRLPLLRIINSQLVSYYLDERGKRMPLTSKFTARVPVATGNIFTNAEHQTKSDSVTEQNLFTLADYIHRDSFLTSITEQIFVDQKNEINLISLIGNNTILLGDTRDLDEKFGKLKTFYRETANRVDLDQYRVINLKYENEVYCERRDEVRNKKP